MRYMRQKIKIMEYSMIFMIATFIKHQPLSI